MPGCGPDGEIGGESVRAETEQAAGHEGRRSPEDVAFEVVEPDPAAVPVLVPPAALIGEFFQRWLVHPDDLARRRNEIRRAVESPDHRYDHQLELDGVDRRQVAEDLD